MHNNETVTVTLIRDVEAYVVPVGTKVTLQKGETAYISQSLGGSHTVVVNGNMFRIDSQNADALGMEVVAKPKATGAPVTTESLEKEIWNQLKTCYDPEIPVNIVDLGLVYSMDVEKKEDSSFKVNVAMTLTAPGCGMGPAIAEDAKGKILLVPGVGDADVRITWDPPWNQSMISEEGKMKLGLV
jgi:probable FeS assembly SUF system protein SufT